MKLREKGLNILVGLCMTFSLLGVTEKVSAQTTGVLTGSKPNGLVTGRVLAMNGEIIPLRTLTPIDSLVDLFSNIVTVRIGDFAQNIPITKQPVSIPGKHRPLPAKPINDGNFTTSKLTSNITVGNDVTSNFVDPQSLYPPGPDNPYFLNKADIDKLVAFLAQNHSLFALTKDIIGQKLDYSELNKWIDDESLRQKFMPVLLDYLNAQLAPAEFFTDNNGKFITLRVNGRVLTLKLEINNGMLTIALCSLGKA